MTFSYKLARRLALDGLAFGAVLVAVACGRDLPSDPRSTEEPSNNLSANTPLGSRVITTDEATILSTPSSSGIVLGTQPKAARGTLVGGPVTDTGGENQIRWQVDFDSGVDGWVEENRLSYTSLPAAPAPVAKVAVTPSTASLDVGGTAQTRSGTETAASAGPSARP